MKTNQFRSLAAVSVLWLALGVGCHKDPPDPAQLYSCNDGTCCDPDTRRYEYSAYLDGVRADLAGDKNVTGIYFQEPQPTNANYPTRLVPLCVLSLDKVQGLQPTAVIGGVSPFKYRVWGKKYWEPGWETLTATPIGDFYIDRIEEVK